MEPVLISFLILAALVLALVLGWQLRRLLPEDHLSNETRETVKLAMGLIGTMAALLLGLLVSSAKGSYDAERTQVIQMAAKISYLNRILGLYGPAAAEARQQFHASVEDAIRRLWPEDKRLAAQLAPNIQAGDAFYLALDGLVPSTPMQGKLKGLAEGAAADLAQQRALLTAQANTSISMPMLVVVVCWLFIIFGSFSLLAPPNLTAMLALLFSTLAVSGAIFLILELAEPFSGLISVPSREMVKAMDEVPK